MTTDDLGTVIQPDGSPVKEREPELSDEALLKLHRTMVAVRALNERGMLLQRQGRIHFYIGSEGQEAIHIGAGAALRNQDWYFPHYRDPGVALWRGATIRDMVHQIYGTGKDLVHGRQMPNHFSFKEQNFFSISSPLSTQIPHAVGAAYAAKVKGDDVVTVASFGDGSSSEGDFHVALNFAGVWKTPTVFLLQNNQWAISVPTELQTASENFAIKAKAYGMPGVQVDGNDILAVYNVMQDATQRARSGAGPTLIEAITYRMGPHSSSDDPTRYVPNEDLESWRKKDPILRFEAYLLHKGVAKEAELQAVRKDLDDEINGYVKEAEATAPPSLETMFEGVYADVPWHLKKQLNELKEILEE